MSKEHPLLERAISLGGDKSRIKSLYNDWAERYDADMRNEVGYVGPAVTAEALIKHVEADAVVLDAGCGTGLVGAELARAAPVVIDGMDLTEGMLASARKTGIYRDLVEADLLATLPFEDNRYDGVVSAGVFTNGHVGPEGLSELIRIAKPGAPIVITVRDTAWEADGFKDAFAKLEADGVIKIREIVHSPYHEKEQIFCQLCIFEPA